VAARLNLDAFSGSIGEVFEVGARDGADGARVALELVEATAQGSRAFAVRFRGPAEPILEQAIYRFERAGSGPLEIFIVPIGRDESGTTYEAIFN
jgi:hypothetical protein